MKKIIIPAVVVTAVAGAVAIVTAVVRKKRAVEA